MSKPGKTVAILGATGVVGATMIQVLESRNFPISELRLLASPRSAGKKIPFRGKMLEVQAVTPQSFQGVDIALFSAGGETSKAWAQIAVESGAWVIDNSSAFRMDPAIPLIVPEVNEEDLWKNDADPNHARIVANPNCSTIQLVVALAPIHRRTPLTRVVVATYQAISGAGSSPMRHFQKQLAAAVAGEPMPEGALSKRLAGNLLMEWKLDLETGYQEEELKIVRETRRILGHPTLSISPTTVRVPVLVSHSEAVTLEAESPLEASEVRKWLMESPGLQVASDPSAYPTPLEVDGQDEVFVGRIRNDIGNAGGIQMWVVADNLRKGAATNAIQIAEAILRKL